MPAKKIKNITDGNELTFIQQLPAFKKAPPRLRYQYTQSATKQGSFLDITEFEYMELLRKGIYKEVPE